MALQEQHVATVENLFASNVFPVVSDSLQVAASQGALKRGTLLTADGKICHKEPTGGGESKDQPVFDEVYAVLAEDVDTTSGAVVAPVYMTGEFREDALIIKTDNSATIADFKASARKAGIFFKPGI